MTDKFSKVTVIIETDDEAFVYMIPKAEDVKIEQDLRDNPDLVFEDPRELERTLSFSFLPKREGESPITYCAVDTRELVDPVAKFSVGELKFAISSLRQYVVSKFTKE